MQLLRKVLWCVLFVPFLIFGCIILYIGIHISIIFNSLPPYNSFWSKELALYFIFISLPLVIGSVAGVIFLFLTERKLPVYLYALFISMFALGIISFCNCIIGLVTGSYAALLFSYNKHIALATVVSCIVIICSFVGMGLTFYFNKKTVAKI